MVEFGIDKGRKIKILIIKTSHRIIGRYGRILLRTQKPPIRNINVTNIIAMKTAIPKRIDLRLEISSFI